jgi:NAD(P)-dependent dehydrogenase (short-subunit alcohol dehydrogenase family)
MEREPLAATEHALGRLALEIGDEVRAARILERGERIRCEVRGRWGVAGLSVEALAAAGRAEDDHEGRCEGDCREEAAHSTAGIGTAFIAMIPCMEIRGRAAIVTGGGGPGTGRAIALRLATGGARIAIADIDEENGTETVRQIESTGAEAEFIRADVTQEEDIRAMIAFAEEAFGGLDILVNSAGLTPEPHFPDAPVEHWTRYLDLNLRGPMLAIHHALDPMRRRGGGAIVNIASIAGVGFAPHSSPEYSAAKAGLIRLSATLAPLAERLNVRVNCIVPNWIGTDEVKSEIAAMSPEERADVPDELTPPEEIAAAVARFVEDEAMAGRVLLWWTSEEPRLIPVSERGM